MQANVVFASCALLRLRKSTTDVTTSTHGRITVLPGLARGAFPKALQKKTAPLDWHQSRSGSRAGTLANAALFLLQAKLKETVFNCMQANVVFGSCALLRLRKSTTDVTTSTHGRITVLTRASQGGVSEGLTKEDSTVGLASEQIRQPRGHAR
ncbi:hypothetical protein MRX96_020369 [Rhipicephalus microplus]